MKKSRTAILLVVLTGFCLLACLTAYRLLAGGAKGDKRDSDLSSPKALTISHRPARSTANPDQSGASSEIEPASAKRTSQCNMSSADLASEGPPLGRDEFLRYLNSLTNAELLQLAEKEVLLMSSEEFRKGKYWQVKYEDRVGDIFEQIVENHDSKWCEKISKELALEYMGDTSKHPLLRSLMLYICTNRGMLKDIPEMSRLAVDLAVNPTEDREVRSFAALLLLEATPREDDHLAAFFSGVRGVVVEWLDGGVFRDVQIEPPQPSLRPNGRFERDYDDWNSFPDFLDRWSDMPLFLPWSYNPDDPNHKKLVELVRADKDTVFRMTLLQGFRDALHYSNGDERRDIMGLMDSLLESDENEAVRALAARSLQDVPIELAEEARSMLQAHKNDHSEMVATIVQSSASVLGGRLSDYRYRAEQRALRTGKKVNSAETGGAVK